ncbi:M6 family metalloprotease domain-containing protein [Luteolibacter sp. Populi]|uniref:M6 family metalloprotease domain-containing protein n=1 Tax=Luteolibacter sp. Populi TaxID=3230487 RepID=UPI003467E934
MKTPSTRTPVPPHRRLPLVFLLSLLLLAQGQLSAAPYPKEGRPTEWTQPDGTRLPLRVFGDDFYARTATPEGYTVLFNPGDLTYYFAATAPGAPSLVRSTIPAHHRPPPGLPKGLAEPKAIAARLRAENLEKALPHQRHDWARRVAAARDRSGHSERGPTAVSKVGLCIPVQFPDDPATATADPVSLPATRLQVDRFCNETGYPDFGNTGSVRDYYHNQSDGQLTFTQLVAPVITLPHPRNYYNFGDYPANTELRAYIDAGGRMVAHAIAALQAQGFDFSTLSVDENSKVLATSLLFAGPDSGVFAEGLWPHRSSIFPSIDVGSPGNPIYISGYQITNAQFQAIPIGTYIHEIGHLLLGYPDLYDQGAESAGVGEHCLMGSGNHLNNGRTPAPLSIYLKDISGWADITDLAPGAAHEADLPTTGNRGLRIANPAAPGEYFLIENRGAGDKWAAACPDQGILIWHVDESVFGNENSEMSPSLHYELSVEQADGAFDLEHGSDRGDASDLFDAATSYFNNGSVPDSRWWSGTASGIAVEVRSPPGAIMNVLLGDKIPLHLAIDAPALTWTSAGDQPWFGQSAVTHDAGDAAASGDIGDSQSSRLETAVTGPGTLSFWWKVSSQANAGFLRLEVDGAPVAAAPQISGNVDWKSQTVPLPPGPHTLRWIYLKDGSGSSGADTGWLDQVAFYPGLAANVLVTTLTDESNGSLNPALGSGTSLREAILHATNSDVIGFLPTLGGGTISLTSGLTVGKSYVIDAPGGITITGNDSYRILDIQSGKMVALKGLKLTHGKATGDGGAIKNAGILTLSQCQLLTNTATDDGGAIYSTGTLTLNSTILSNNSCTDAGGAIDSENTLTLAGCTLSSNTAGDNGGAIFNDDATLTLTDCLLDGNHANGAAGGGAIDNDNGGAVTLTRCTLTVNHANFDGGAIDSDGSLTLHESTLWGNSAATGGGAIQQVSSTLLMSNCTLAANTAKVGAAIDGDGTSTIDLVSCTISDNHASDDGGGIEETSGTLRLTNTIIAGNTAVDIGPDLKASSINLEGGVNLLGTTSGLGGTFSGLTGAPLLSALGNYGGPTPTMPPLAGSSALDHGGATALTIDQRGFPRISGAALDIGAVEAQPGLLIVSTLASSGPGSLRDAIASAIPGDTLTFSPALSGGSIALDGSQLTLDRDIHIDASALPGGITIAGDGLSRVFEIPEGVTASLLGLTIESGYASEFDGGEGGGLLNAGDLELISCMIRGNTADFGGAGIFSRGMLTMQGCTVRDNESFGSGGGIGNRGTMTLSRSTISGNGSGGGSGAGIACEAVDSSAELNLCTIAANFSNASGGGIYHRGQLVLTECTVAANGANDWGGIGNDGGDLTLRHSIVAGNFGFEDEPSDIGGLVGTQSPDNLLGTTTNTVGYTGMVANARLAPLGNYGGPTRTMPPMPGSPVIDASAASGSTDQRGAPRISGPAADLGAVEAVAFSTLPLADTDADGIPDLLEPALGLDLGTDDSAVDSDGDGATDARELADMTDPADSGSYLRITSFELTPGFDPFTHPLVSISFPTFPGLSYHIEADPDADFTGPGYRIVVPTFTATGHSATRQISLGTVRDFVRAVRE